MPRAKPGATGQYKSALYGLRCGDRSIAEYFVRNQPRRARAVAEFVDVLYRLGGLTPDMQQILGLATEQLTLEESTNGGSSKDSYSRLEFIKERLARSGNNGLEIWSLVTEIGREEKVANPRDRNWRGPVAAELNEYADLGYVVSVQDRFYHLSYAPVASLAT